MKILPNSIQNWPKYVDLKTLQILSRPCDMAKTKWQNLAQPGHTDFTLRKVEQASYSLDAIIVDKPRLFLCFTLSQTFLLTGDVEQLLNLQDVVLGILGQLVEVLAVGDGRLPAWHRHVLHFESVEFLKWFRLLIF